MNITCLDCARQWRSGCPECAEEKAEKHRTENPEHQVHVTGSDDTKGRGPVDWEETLSGLPTWMHGTIRKGTA